MLIAPELPLVAKEAAVANPGGVSTVTAPEHSSSPGSYGSVRVGDGASGTSTTGSRRKVWISIELRDDTGRPVANEPYEIKVPGESSPRTGTLNQKGRARLDGIDEGQCEVSFPQIDGREWSKIATKASAT